MAFCKTYADFWLCDTYTIQRELERIATLNIEALQAMQESVQTNKIPEIRQKQKLEQLAKDTARVGFSRETQKRLTEMLWQKKQSEHEKSVQMESEEFYARTGQRRKTYP